MANEQLESQLESDLEALFKGQGSAPAKGTESAADPNPAADNKPGADASQPPANTPADATDDSDASDASDVELTDKEKMLKALEALDPEEKPKEGEQKPPAAPALSEDQQTILQHIPNAEVAQTLVNIANSHTAFETALVEGDFEKIEGMFTHWNKGAYDNLLENIYDKYVKSGEWVRRFVGENDAENNGNTYEHQRQTKLEKEVAELKGALKQRSVQEQNDTYTQQQQRIATAYSNELNRLFDHIGLKEETDRKFIRAAVNADVRANKQLATEISQGNLKGLVKVFKANADPYLSREAGIDKAKIAKIKDQEKHKQPVGGGGGAPTTDNLADKSWKEVPKGKEDETLAAKLGSFFGSRGKKK